MLTAERWLCTKLTLLSNTGKRTSDMQQTETANQEHPTPTRRLAYCALYVVVLCVAIVAVLALFSVLQDKPFGFQIAAVITYTGAAYWLTFCRTSLYASAYALTNSRVRLQLPRLVAIHFICLLGLLAALAVASHLRPHLPAFWFENGAKGTLFSNVTILVCTGLLLTEVEICRRILSRAVDAKTSP